MLRTTMKSKGWNGIDLDRIEALLNDRHVVLHDAHGELLADKDDGHLHGQLHEAATPAALLLTISCAPYVGSTRWWLHALILKEYGQIRIIGTGQGVSKLPHNSSFPFNQVSLRATREFFVPYV